MQRYKEGKPRFLVMTVNGEPGYAIFRLDGRWTDGWRDRKLTLVYKSIRTRRRAEQVARRCAERGVTATSTKFQLPLLTKQEDMRRRHTTTKAETRIGPVTAQYLTPRQVAEEHQVSIKTVIRKCKGLPGVLDWGSRRTPTAKDPRTHVSNLRIPREALEHFKIKT